MRLQVQVSPKAASDRHPQQTNSVAREVQPDAKKRLGGAPTVRRTMALKALGLA